MTAEQYAKALKELKLTYTGFAKLVGRYDSRARTSGAKGPPALLLCLLMQKKISKDDIEACRVKDDARDPRSYYARVQLMGD